MIHLRPAPRDVLVTPRTRANPRAAPDVFHNSPAHLDLSRTATCPGRRLVCFRGPRVWQGPVERVLVAGAAGGVQGVTSQAGLAGLHRGRGSGGWQADG